jgi:hypothetical protein
MALRLNREPFPRRPGGAPIASLRLPSSETQLRSKPAGALFSDGRHLCTPSFTSSLHQDRPPPRTAQAARSSRVTLGDLAGLPLLMNAPCPQSEQISTRGSDAAVAAPICPQLGQTIRVSMSVTRAAGSGAEAFGQDRRPARHSPISPATKGLSPGDKKARRDIYVRASSIEGGWKFCPWIAAAAGVSGDGGRGWRRSFINLTGQLPLIK